jgi:hypothetical protein
MSYRILENKYLELSIKSEEFRHNKDFKLETLLNRYMTHSDGQISLDIARDYLYFLDESYDIKEYKRPKVEKDVRDDVNPYKGWYERYEK